MDKNKLLDEIKDNSLDELETIYETQKDLYSEEEMKVIKERIEQYKKEKLNKLLPKEIECSKCFGMNPFKNDECTFCGAKLNKEKYYSLDYYDNKSNERNDLEESESYLFQYIISFLIPLVGFILGAIMMGKDDSEKVDVGKKCVITGIVSIVIYVVITMVIINS